MGFIAVICVIAALIVAVTEEPLLFTVVQWLLAGIVFAILAGVSPWVPPWRRAQ